MCMKVFTNYDLIDVRLQTKVFDVFSSQGGGNPAYWL